MEKDDEVKGSGNSLDFGARMYDSRIGRFRSVDPKTASYPHYTPYSFAGNKPITHIDKNGEHEWNIIVNPDANGTIQSTEISLVRTGAIGVTSRGNIGGDVVHYRNGNNGNRIANYMVGVNGGYLFNNEQSVINSAIATNPLPAGAGNTSWPAGIGTLEKIIYNNQTQTMTILSRAGWQTPQSFGLSTVPRASLFTNSPNLTPSFSSGADQTTFQNYANQYNANNNANFQVTASSQSVMFTGPNLTTQQQQFNSNLTTLLTNRANFLRNQLISSGVPASNISTMINPGGGAGGATISMNPLQSTTQQINPTNGSTGTSNGDNVNNVPATIGTL